MDSKVYFIKASVNDGQQVVSDKAAKLFKAGGFASCFKENDFTAIKVHIGEEGNTTYIKAPYIRGLVGELLALKTKPFVADTSTLYVGRRHNAVDHAILAAEHGFSPEGLGVPFVAPDGLFGTAETAVEINGQINKKVFIASDIVRSQSILTVAHFTGHIITCAAGTLKTLGMGCASRKGKMRQHAAFKPSIGDKCERCGECVKYCPAEAISLDEVKANIDQDKCIGCAECVAVCRFDAVKYDWDADSEVLQRNMAEHALGAVKGKENKAAFFNYIISITKDCDCFKTPDMPKIVDDIGIAASTDPVAVDKAAVDLVQKKAGKKFGELLGSSKLNPLWQIEHAEQLGLGSTKYELIDVH